MNDPVHIVYYVICLLVMLGMLGYMLLTLLNPDVRPRAQWPWIVLVACAFALFIAPSEFSNFYDVELGSRGTHLYVIGIPALVVNILFIILWVVGVIWSIVMLRRGVSSDIDTSDNWN